VKESCVAGSAWDFKLRGNPWDPKRSEVGAVRMNLLDLLELLESQGWSLYASVNHKRIDGWYCNRVKGWVPGSPTLHR
jgi:hypothetical protein